MKVKRISLLMGCIFMFSLKLGYGQTLSPNGYSGLGLVPDGKTLNLGVMSFSFDPTLPGSLINNGYNSQIGFGLTKNLELVGRLATNDLKCNMFQNGACPANTIRDFSASLKWRFPIDWLKNNKTDVSIGATDFGGASTYFRSYYAVGTKTFDQIDISLGLSSAKAVNSMLKGPIAAVSWRPENWLEVNLQKNAQTTSSHMILKTKISEFGANAWITFNTRISEAPVVNKNWIGWGISTPLDKVQEKTSSTMTDLQKSINKTKELQVGEPDDLLRFLNNKGFYNSKIGTKSNGKLIIVVENTAYIWNNLDAAGVALGVISSAYSSAIKEQEFELVISTRGVEQLKISGEASCVGKWLSMGQACNKLSVHSLLQRSTNLNSSIKNLDQNSIDLDETINWTTGSSWQLRPEIVLSPTLTSSIGTEYGALDFELGANINAVVPLWTGATFEVNRVEPLGVETKQFEQNGVFYGSRIKAVTNRRLVHQIINVPAINTQARLSLGTAYSLWNGQQIETSTQSDSGRHKLGYTGGSFKNDSLTINQVRNYSLLNYRLVNNDQQTAVTEFTQGKFWAGDKGFSLNQRFWYGDSTLNVYFRRTRMEDVQPLRSFAGIQLAFPFTPRENKSLEKLGLRGVSQWTYSLETKVMERDNTITGGYGEVPRVGDSLVMILNRDRNSTRYYDTNMSRMRDAYLNLGSN